MTEKEVHKYAKQLRDYATHFAMRDWDYTRKHNIHAILYKNGWRRTRSGKRYYFDPSRLPARLWSAVAGLRRDLPWNKQDWEREVFSKVRWHHMFRARLRDRTNVDGWLDNGGVITFWEETGEYLQYVQPSVGALLADLMDAHPDLPEVRAIAKEMKRIQKRYAERIEKEGWGG